MPTFNIHIRVRQIEKVGIGIGKMVGRDSRKIPIPEKSRLQIVGIQPGFGILLLELGFIFYMDYQT
jgi:hypothetical protein